MFKPFHNLLISRLQDIANGENIKRNLLVNIPFGCVSGDTMIRYNRCKLGRKKSIKACYESFNHIGAKNHHWNGRTYIRSFKDNHIGLNEAIDFVYSGKKIVYELILENGNSIKATPEHEIMTRNGWKELISLTPEDEVMVDTIEEHLRIHGNYNNFGHGAPEYSKVSSVKEKGLEDTYDIQCNNPYNNFSANDIVVHNSGKSMLIELFLTWCFARNTNITFCYVSHSDRLIKKLSKEVRDMIMSPEYNKLFGINLKTDDKAKTNFSFEGANIRTGLTAGTMGGAITGLDAGGIDINNFTGALVIDDPIDAGNIRYELFREECIRAYTDKLSTRCRNPRVPVIVIMQRLHQEDLSGWIIKNDPENWDILIIPALNEYEESFWPERYPAKDILKERLINPFKFYSQYQQNPVVEGGSVIKTEWFNEYASGTIEFERIFITSDTAMSKKEHADYSVFLAWGVKSNCLYLIDGLRGKWEAPELKQKALDFWNQFKDYSPYIKCHAFYVEVKASGIGLFQELNSGYSIPIIPVDRQKRTKDEKIGTGDKLARLEDALPYLESGKVYLPHDKQISKDLIAECEAFQRDLKHKHDDIIDPMVDAINKGICNYSISILDVL